MNLLVVAECADIFEVGVVVELLQQRRAIQCGKVERMRCLMLLDGCRDPLIMRFDDLTVHRGHHEDVPDMLG